MKSWTRSCILKNLVDIDFQHRKAMGDWMKERVLMKYLHDVQSFL